VVLEQNPKPSTFLGRRTQEHFPKEQRRAPLLMKAFDDLASPD
jgi:hypothetical protein